MKFLSFVEYSFNKITFIFEMQWLAYQASFYRLDAATSAGEIPPIFPQLKPTFGACRHRQAGLVRRRRKMSAERIEYLAIEPRASMVNEL